MFSLSKVHHELTAVHSIARDKNQKIPPASIRKQEEKWCEIQNPSQKKQQHFLDVVSIFWKY